MRSQSHSALRVCVLVCVCLCARVTACVRVCGVDSSGGESSDNALFVLPFFQSCGVALLSCTQNYVRITAGSGCLSTVGRAGGQNLVSLAADGSCPFGSVVHELGHSLGLLHTQTRLDRDSYVTIKFADIVSAAVNNFNKYSVGCYGSAVRAGAAAAERYLTMRYNRTCTRRWRTHGWRLHDATAARARSMTSVGLRLGPVRVRLL